MATKTELETALATETQHASELQARIDELQAQATATPDEPQLSKLDCRKLYADNTTVVTITRAYSMKRKDDGTTVEGGFDIPAIQSLQIQDAASESGYKRVKVQETWFTAWDNGTEEEPNPVGSQLMALATTTKYAVVRLYWEFSSSAKDVVEVQSVNEKTGKAFTEHKFKYPAKKRIFAFDVIKKEDLDSPETTNIPF